MMGYGYGGWGSQMTGFGSFGVIWTINGILIAVLLVVLIRYFWTKGGKK